MGKYLGKFRQLYNSASIYYLLLSRLFFFYSMPLISKSFTQHDYLLNNHFFPYLNMFLFAFTSGLFTSNCSDYIDGCFILSNEKTPDTYKKNAGALIGIFLQLGVTIGTIFAVPFIMLVRPDV